MDKYKLTIVWVVHFKGYARVIFDSFKDAWVAYKAEELSRMPYPKIMSLHRRDSLKEFQGF